MSQQQQDIKLLPLLDKEGSGNVEGVKEVKEVGPTVGSDSTLKEKITEKVDEEASKKNTENKQVMKFVDEVNELLRNKKTDDVSYQYINSLRDLILAAQSENFHLCTNLLNVAIQIFQQLDLEQLDPNHKVNPNTLIPQDDVLGEIVNNSSAKEGLRQFLILWNMLNNSFYAKLENAMSDPNFAKIIGDAKNFINLRCGGQIDLFLLRLKSLIELIEKDSELQSFLKELLSHLNSAIDKPDSLRSDDYKNKRNTIYSKLQSFARKYQNNINIRSLFYEARILAEVTKHPTVMPTPEGNIISSLGSISLTNENFLPILRKEIIPFLASKLKEIPVKGFKISNEDFEYLTVDDIYVSVDDILPDHIGINSENKAVVKMNDSKDPLTAQSKLNIMIYGLRLIVKDFFFSFKRTTPIVDIKDEGRGTIKLKGEGLTIFINYDFNVDAKREIPVLQKGTVEVHLDKFDLDFTEANHKILLNVASSLFKPAVQKEIENAVKLNIEQYGTELAELLNKQIITL